MNEITTAPAPTQMGFFNLESYQLMERIADRLTQSTMIPEQYRAMVADKSKESKGTLIPNHSAVPNMIIALNMAQRMNADPLMVMQNLHVIEGRPAWSSVWIIAQVNNCGRFSPLQFDLEQGELIDVEYSERYWNKQKFGGGGWDFQRKVITIQNKSCVAYATDLKTGKVLKSIRVDMAMAVREGWYGKNGSKWQTMDELMLTYRTASFFGKVYAPELLMGLPSREEMEDITEKDITPDVELVTPEPVTMPERKSKRNAEPKPQTEAAPEAPAKPTEPEAVKTEEAPAPSIETPPAATEAVQGVDPVVCLSAGQVGFVNKKILNFGVNESALFSAFGVESVEQLPAAKINDVLKWIDENKGE